MTEVLRSCCSYPGDGQLKDVELIGVITVKVQKDLKDELRVNAQFVKHLVIKVY